MCKVSVSAYHSQVVIENKTHFYRPPLYTKRSQSYEDLDPSGKINRLSWPLTASLLPCRRSGTRGKGLVNSTISSMMTCARFRAAPRARLSHLSRRKADRAFPIPVLSDGGAEL